jgi:hypothetical protein
MPSKTLLLSAQGRSMLVGLGNMGWILAHCLSVSRSALDAIFSSHEAKSHSQK